jgi:acetyl esterase
LGSLSESGFREFFSSISEQLEAESEQLETIQDFICPTSREGIRLRLYDCRKYRDQSPVIVFFHGGGFVVGGLQSHHSLCSAIANLADLPVVAVDYRLAPEHPFPAAFDDCAAAARWIAENPSALGFKATGLITFGDSAGGNLAICVAQELVSNPAKVPLLLQVPLYPMIDASEHGSMIEFGEGYILTKDLVKWYLERYDPAPDDRRAFPLVGDLAATPPTILVTAGLDPLRDQGRRYAAALIEAGVDCHFMEMRGTVHGFANLRKALPSAQDDLVAVIDALRSGIAKFS